MASRNFGKSLAHRGGPIIMCDDPDPHLTDVQLAALHECKHEILASIFRLYQTVPQPIADKILSKYIKLPVDD